MEKLLTKKEVMEMLGIKESTLYAWVHQNRLPFLKLGKRLLRFREKDILEWIADKASHPKTDEEQTKARGKRTLTRGMMTDGYVDGLIDRAKRDVLKK